MMQALPLNACASPTSSRSPELRALRIETVKIQITSILERTGTISVAYAHRMCSQLDAHPHIEGKIADVIAEPLE